MKSLNTFEDTHQNPNGLVISLADKMLLRDNPLGPNQNKI